MSGKLILAFKEGAQPGLKAWVSVPFHTGLSTWASPWVVYASSEHGGCVSRVSVPSDKKWKLLISHILDLETGMVSFLLYYIG